MLDKVEAISHNQSKFTNQILCQHALIFGLYFTECASGIAHSNSLSDSFFLCASSNTRTRARTHAHQQIPAVLYHQPRC